MIRNLIRQYLSEDTRFQLYALRHPAFCTEIRSQVHPSSKGDFSLRAFDEKQCIFVHITKTAGTSVALSLFGELPYHYTARNYQAIFGRSDFNRYFKFCFVRNPWDRLYSAWRYLKNGGWDEQDKIWAEENLPDTDNFNEFVMDWLTAESLSSHIHFKPQHKFICDYRSKIIVDFCGRFEDLVNDYGIIARTTGTVAPLKSKNITPGTHSYRDIYNEASKEKVATLYAKDIALLGYTFNGWTENLPRNLPAE